MTDWWQGFFDADYVQLWDAALPADRTEREAEGLWALLNLGANSKVLDAPCGYGRLSHALAKRGANVLGVDFSVELLAAAESRRGGVSTDRLRYREHDLRAPLAEGDFDVALNIFSSLGYGTEADDLSILSTLRAAVRPGGLVFVETNHRDAVVLGLSRTQRPAQRLSDGTLLLEEPRFDPVAGRIDTTWYFGGPRGSGAKPASFRIYTATELVALLQSVGLVVRSTHAGCSTQPFASAGAPGSNRLGILAVRD